METVGRSASWDEGKVSKEKCGKTAANGSHDCGELLQYQKEERMKTMKVAASREKKGKSGKKVLNCLTQGMEA